MINTAFASMGLQIQGQMQYLLSLPLILPSLHFSASKYDVNLIFRAVT